ncbi:unnamed protein product [Effrenium voratum]|nr:unnamed protein product [Effrenium voratum]
MFNSFQRNQQLESTARRAYCNHMTCRVSFCGRKELRAHQSAARFQVSVRGVHLNLAPPATLSAKSGGLDRACHAALLQERCNVVYLRMGDLPLNGFPVDSEKGCRQETTQPRTRQLGALDF